MKLNNDFLATMWEKDLKNGDQTLKGFFLNFMTDPRNRELWGEEEWAVRQTVSRHHVTSPAGMKRYYVTPKAQAEANLIATGKDIDLKWFVQIPDMECMYITGKGEFFRFYKAAGNIYVMCCQYRDRPDGKYIWFDAYRIDLSQAALMIGPNQNKEQALRFINLLLFIELGEVTIQEVKPKQKVYYGKKGDEKLLNEAGLSGVYVVNSNWNKVLKVTEGFLVRGHFRVQPYGPGRSLYRLQWISDFQKKGYTVNKNLSHNF